jgi:hypothetical protein
LDRRIVPAKYEIQEYVDRITTDRVEDDLSEISYLVFSDQTDSNGNRFGYAASDKEQFSLKVIRFTNDIFAGPHLNGVGTTVATYTLNLPSSPINDDWEDISLGPCTDTNVNTGGYTTDQVCIYIGNFGNNARAGYTQRAILTIFKFVEPPFVNGLPRDQSVNIATIQFQYGTGFDQSTTLTPVYYDGTKKPCTVSVLVSIVSHYSINFPSNFSLLALLVLLGDPPWLLLSALQSPNASLTTAEAMFVDWVGASGVTNENKGDVYVVTKGGCNGGVGKISVAQHRDLSPGTTSSSPFPMPEIVGDPPRQGSVTCTDSAYRTWVGADMRRDGRLIAMLRGAGNTPSVYFFPRLPQQSVAEALGLRSCGYVSATSQGNLNQNKHEAVAFIDAEGLRFADTSECSGSGSCKVPVYFYELVYPYSNFPAVVEPTDNGWQRITYDDFESINDPWGNYMPGSASIVVSTDFDTTGGDTCGGNCACGGTRSALILDDLGPLSSFSHKSNMPCADYRLLRVTFMFKLRGYDSLDAFFMEISLDGGLNYVQVDHWALDVDGILQNANCYSGKVVLSPEQFRLKSFGNQVRLRFLNRGNAVDDKAYIDNILFEGYPI